jgi:rod shape-determining protein MreD
VTSVIAFASVIIAGIAVTQSTVLRFIEILGAQPDLVLIVVVFVANKNGMMAGQVSGFVGGVVLDSIGLAPLGFHAVIFTLIGALFGITRGKVFVDPVLMPVLMGLIAVLLKGIFAALIGSVFGMSVAGTSLFSTAYWIELGYTALATPLIFALLALLKFIQPDVRRGEVF